MSKLPQISRLMREDFREAPNWIDKLIVTLNIFMSAIYYALDGQLTFTDNVRSVLKTFTLTAASTASGNTIKLPLPNWKPTGVMIIQVLDNSGDTLLAAPGVSWAIGQNVINIQAIHGLTAGHKYTVTLLIV